LSHLPNWKTGSLANDGVLGEQLSLQTLNEKTGLNFKPLQNGSNHGCDGCTVAIDGDTIIVMVMDAKSSVNGVSKARTPHGDPEARLRGWLANRSITQSDPALATALESALQNGEVKVQGVTVKVGLPAPGKTGQAEIKVEPWLKK
jgi:filamentous hemagglutinin